MSDRLDEIKSLRYRDEDGNGDQYSVGSGNVRGIYRAEIMGEPMLRVCYVGDDEDLMVNFRHVIAIVVKTI